MSRQIYNKENVLDAARQRISLIFDRFEAINVSVSGGKDSTVLAHLMLMEARRRNRRIGLFFLDAELVHDSSIQQIDYLMTLDPEHTRCLWLQVPFCLTNAVSLTEPQLICWEPGKERLWLRRRDARAIHVPPWDRATETIRDKTRGFGFHDAMDNFQRCYTDTAIVVGLRAAESMNRWRAVVKHPVDVGDRAVYWATRKGANTALYPLYDWTFSDVWRYIHDEGLRYSKIYDYQHRKGLPIQEMRNSYLIHKKSFKELVDLPEFEPLTYERLCQRVKGVVFAQETGKTMFSVRKLPKAFKSWRAYRDFLLETYPAMDKKPLFVQRFQRHKSNEYVARQQCRQLVLNDYENNLPVDNKDDPRLAVIQRYVEDL